MRIVRKHQFIILNFVFEIEVKINVLLCLTFNHISGIFKRLIRFALYSNINYLCHIYILEIGNSVSRFESEFGCVQSLYGPISKWNLLALVFAVNTYISKSMSGSIRTKRLAFSIFCIQKRITARKTTKTSFVKICSETTLFILHYDFLIGYFWVKTFKNNRRSCIKKSHSISIQISRRCGWKTLSEEHHWKRLSIERKVH